MAKKCSFPERRGKCLLTGERLGSVELPSAAQYGMMTYLHEGRQFIVVQIGGRDYPSSLVALALPETTP